MKSFLTIALLATLSFAAGAQTAATQATPSRDSATASNGGDAHRQPDAFCLRSTGSLIAASENERARRQGKPQTACAAAAGRSFTQDDIRRTGQMNLSDALRTLDPAIR